ncbi:DNA replication terminus site-binding protein [Erwinia psidii]|uniref:DNA replication terminus site-binding protein n=1 Tax=Erwinia psidii TaxID=69224 RepID=A0A3N6S1R1_9GAMM|nr:DNA replication terminus site-binding protein [Erwinia psidii]MCX8956063.1 DNA replication terminus site-binding protein [Erwinia psidii]MCX8960170.1 DNA replication terminus site-binding protein [Erwinia psidii]MCX8963717.1 DNA replication terminus site-binding protein [Erwinia psidii]RQM38767.1 DNA replication terminus site-binding protein [Erwinia psidii]
MSRYDAVENLRLCVAELENALSLFTVQVQQQRLLFARVFELPPVKKGEDHRKVTEINVVQHLAQPALQMALTHYCRLFMQHQSETLSTKSAVRLPGAICIEANSQHAALIRYQVQSINNLKAKLEKIITVDSGVSSEERFEFVHQQLRGLITLNAYRTITVLDNVDSVRFGWANKHIIKNVSRQSMLDKLNKSILSGRSSTPWTREQWAEKLQEEIAMINSLPEKARLKIKRPVKVQPIARVWNKQQQKQTQLACPSPLLILCADTSAIPKTGELLNYDAKRIVHRFKPEAETLYPVIPRLHLYSDR